MRISLIHPPSACTFGNEYLVLMVFAFFRRNLAIFWLSQLAVKSRSTFSPLAGTRRFRCDFWRSLMRFTFSVIKRTREETIMRFSSRSALLAIQWLHSKTQWNNVLSFSCRLLFSIYSICAIFSPFTIMVLFFLLLISIPIKQNFKNTRTRYLFNVLGKLFTLV